MSDKYASHIKFINQFILKLCNPNGWTFYMQLKYINITFMPKYFLSGF